MKVFQLFFICVLAVAAEAAGTVLELVNGDRVSGEIMKIESGIVFVRTALMSEVQIPRASVRSGLETPVAANPSTTAQEVVPPAQAKQAAPEKKTEAKPEKKIEEKHADPSLRDVLHIPKSLTGKIRASAYRRRRDYLEDYIEIAPSLSWTDKKKIHSLKWALRYRYRRDNNSTGEKWEKEDDEFTAEQKYRYNFDKTTFTQSRTYWQQDRVDDIEPRFIQSLSLGLYLLNNDLLKLDLAPGIGYEYLNNDNVVTETATPTFEQTFRWAINSRFSFEQNFTYVGDDREFQYDFTNELEAKLNGSLSVVLKHSLEYEQEQDDGETDKSRDERMAAAVQLSF
jgi:putative salt-induced outer membrane protein YdiY